MFRFTNDIVSARPNCSLCRCCPHRSLSSQNFLFQSFLWFFQIGALGLINNVNGFRPMLNHTIWRKCPQTVFHTIFPQNMKLPLFWRWIKQSFLMKRYWWKESKRECNNQYSERQRFWKIDLKKGCCKVIVPSGKCHLTAKWELYPKLAAYLFCLRQFTNEQNLSFPKQNCKTYANLRERIHEVEWYSQIRTR